MLVQSVAVALSETYVNTVTLLVVTLTVGLLEEKKRL